MARSFQKSRARREYGTFARLTHAILESEEYAELSPREVKALLDILAQYRGRNNGNLSAAYSIMRKKGWTSKGQLQKALEVLIRKEWILISRRSTKRREPTLYAVTFEPINECDVKLDVSPTPVAPHLWKKDRRGEDAKDITRSRRRVHQKKSVARDTGQVAPPDGVTNGGVGTTLPRDTGRNAPLSPISLPRDTGPF